MNGIKSVIRGTSHSWPSKRLIASYVLDWLVIFAIAGVGGVFNYVKPYHRPFSLLDLAISYPLIHSELVPVQTLLYVCGLAPAVIIAIVALFWEFKKGWAGFCLSLAVAFFITQAMKNIFGKPRPNMLARCEPSLRNHAASPPNHLVVIAFIPVGIVVWICLTRYAEFYHFGFDIISGSLIGILSAWFAFRWYHLPIRNGQGWALGARSRTRAFGIGVGTGNYVGDEGWETGRRRRDDIEANGS